MRCVGRSAGNGSRLWQPAAPLVHQPANRYPPRCVHSCRQSSAAMVTRILSLIMLALGPLSCNAVLRDPDAGAAAQAGYQVPRAHHSGGLRRLLCRTFAGAGGVLATCLCTGWLCVVLSLQSHVHASQQHRSCNVPPSTSAVPHGLRQPRHRGRPRAARLDCCARQRGSAGRAAPGGRTGGA